MGTWWQGERKIVSSGTQELMGPHGYTMGKVLAPPNGRGADFPLWYNDSIPSCPGPMDAPLSLCGGLAPNAAPCAAGSGPGPVLHSAANDFARKASGPVKNLGDTWGCLRPLQIQFEEPLRPPYPQWRRPSSQDQ